VLFKERLKILAVYQILEDLLGVELLLDYLALTALSLSILKNCTQIGFDLFIC
jgi:hypothetical protein